MTRVLEYVEGNARFIIALELAKKIIEQTEQMFLKKRNNNNCELNVHTLATTATSSPSIDVISLVRNECDESDIVAKHFRSAKSQFFQFLPNFLRIIFQVHYCSISFNSYNFLKNISLKLKSSITFDKKALQPCKGHFWTDGISKFSENILALPFPPC